MLNKTDQATLRVKLSGLKFFPAEPMAQAAVIDVLAAFVTADRLQEYCRQVLTEFDEYPGPRSLVEFWKSSFSPPPNYDARELYQATLDEPHGTVEAMRAGAVWQPRPYPKRCSACGGLGYVYVQIKAPGHHAWAGTIYYAVQRCVCLPPVQADGEPKGRKR